jgi:RimJ/RimL family protein N-acetyltransferase
MIITERLLLRAYTLADALPLHRLVSVREIALNTLRIPHPYPVEEAVRWISSHVENQDKDDHVFAVVARDVDELVGTVGLHLKADNDSAEIGYWIGVPYWGRGFATEAAAAVLRHGFANFPVNRIYAMHFGRNPASGRVLQKIGMRHEGTLRQHIKKWGEYVDLECYGILRSDWNSSFDFSMSSSGASSKTLR